MAQLACAAWYKNETSPACMMLMAFPAWMTGMDERPTSPRASRTHLSAPVASFQQLSICIWVSV